MANVSEKMTVEIDYEKLAKVFKEWGIPLPPLETTPICCIDVGIIGNKYTIIDKEAIWQYEVSHSVEYDDWCYYRRHCGRKIGDNWTDWEVFDLEV